MCVPSTVVTWRPSYADKADLKVRLGGYQPADTTDDDALDQVLAAASRTVDAFTHRQFGVTGTGATMHGRARWSRNRARYVIDLADTLVLTAIAVDTNDDATFISSMATGWKLLPLDAAAEGRPYVEAELLPAAAYRPVAGADVRCTGTFGWAAVPAAVVEATLIQAARLWAGRGAPLGVAGSPEAGNELRLLERLHPDVPVLLAGYRRTTGAVTG